MFLKKEIKETSSFQIIENMTSSQYHSVDILNLSVSSSMIRSFQNTCPARFWYECNNQRLEHNKVFSTGTAVHSYLLQKDKFLQDVVVMPKEFLDYRKKEAQTFRDESLASGRAVILYSELESLKEYEKALNNHNFASKALLAEHGKAEMSVFCKDNVNNITLKARPDFVNNTLGIIIDYKTTVCAGKEEFTKAIFNYGYYQQAAWYLDICKQAGLGVDSFLIIAQEKTPPHLVNVFMIDDEYIELGRLINKHELSKLAKCYHRNEWPGYSDEIISVQAKELSTWQQIEIEKRL